MKKETSDKVIKFGYHLICLIINSIIFNIGLWSLLVLKHKPGVLLALMRSVEYNTFYLIWFGGLAFGMGLWGILESLEFSFKKLKEDKNEKANE